MLTVVQDDRVRILAELDRQLIASGEAATWRAPSGRRRGGR